MRDRHREFLAGRARRRLSWGVETIALLSAMVAACDGDASPPELSGIEAGYEELIDSAGAVLGVSVQGRVLSAGPDGEWCVVDVDGSDRQCGTAGGRIEPGAVQWSPDGSRVAFDGRLDRAAALDSDVRVLDVETGAMVILADDGSDDPRGPQDLLPAWLDDSTLAFLRDRGGSLEIVFAEASDVETADIVSVDLTDVIPPAAAVLDGDYVLAVGHDAPELVAIDDDGAVRSIVELPSPDARRGGTSRDTERAVITSGLAGDELTAVTHVGEGGATTAPFAAVAATVSPDGHLVAAVAADEPGLTLWDPESGETRRLDPGQTALVDQPRGVVWTDDERLIIWSDTSWQVVTLAAPG